jgi:hypothetical protein
MKRNLIKKIVILLTVVLLFTVGIFQLVKYDSVKNAIILATTMKPQTLTELYFENHLSLPDEVTLFEKSKFEFTIHNLENKDVEYFYEVYINANGEKQIILMNSDLIKNSEYKTISVDFIIKVPVQRYQVVVNLINENQQIFFWVGEE